ncbi:hypothetical protein M5689_023982 [Euphorbia peplus]|nr:hypothetical protein M5689_023982 [Euphorbia peplus]
MASVFRWRLAAKHLLDEGIMLRVWERWWQVAVTCSGHRLIQSEWISNGIFGTMPNYWLDLQQALWQLYVLFGDLLSRSRVLEVVVLPHYYSGTYTQINWYS